MPALSTLSHVHHGGCACTIAANLRHLVHPSAIREAGAATDWGTRRRAPRPLIVPEIADLIVTGRVQTMNSARAEVEAIAVTGGWITAVGDLRDIEGLKGPATEVLDLGDSVAYPGFVEPHMHIWAAAVLNDWMDLDCRHGATFDGLVAKIKAATPLNGWVLGTQFDPSLLAGEPELTRAVLDEAVPDVPALILNASMHYAYANSKALEAAGLTDDTADPPGGFVGRSDGRLNGVLGEMPAMMQVVKVLPAPQQDHFVDNLLKVSQAAATAGYTHIHDAGTGMLLGAGEPGLLAHIEDRLATRVTYAVSDEVIEKVMQEGVVPGVGTDRVRPVSWKIVSDGSNQGRSGYMKDDYLGRDTAGHPNVTVDYMTERIRMAGEKGWQMMIHANGDAAIENAIAAYAAALSDGEGFAHRHRIEHCSLATAANLQEMTRLGLSPSYLMNHVYYWGRTFCDNVLGPERAGRLDPMGTSEALGMRATMHSDYTVTQFEPLREIQTAVDRRMRVGGEVLNEALRCSVDYALAAKTINAAWQTHSEDYSGSIEVGKRADLTILSADPRTADVEHIADISVVRTVVDGVTVYQAG